MMEFVLVISAILRRFCVLNGPSDIEVLLLVNLIQITVLALWFLGKTLAKLAQSAFPKLLVKCVACRDQSATLRKTQTKAWFLDGRFRESKSEPSLK